MDTAAQSSGLLDASPYTVIARGYDFIMAHIDYEHWAVFTDDLLWKHHPNPRSIRELGCGTGSFALHLQPLGEYDYTGTDLCPEMIAVARQKAEEDEIQVTWAVEDFTKFRVAAPHDVIILLYDGLNYLLDEDEVASMLECVYEALRPGGIFFFDQSTPANSINNEAFFCDEGELDGFSYVRGSEYDRETRLHITTFEISIDGQSYVERHIQRAYTLEEIRTQILNAGFEIEATFDGFSSRRARESSERVHWLVRKPI